MKVFPRSILFLAIALFATQARGQFAGDTDYTGNPSGSFEDPANWTAGVPNINLYAVVSTGGTFAETDGTGLVSSGNTTINLTESANEAADGIEFFSTYNKSNNNSTVPGTVNFNITNGSTLTLGQDFDDTLVVTNQTTLNYSGGTINIVSGDIVLGETLAILNLQSTGTMNVTGGTLNDVDGDLDVGFGDGSTGTFTESGPSNVTVGGLYVGGDDATGTLGLKSGTLSVLSFGYVGDGLSGTFNQSGGTFNYEGANTEFVVGFGGTGVYNLSGGVANITTGLIVGEIGTGIVNQSGGTLNVNGEMFDGDAGTGIYNLSGGTANFNGGLVVGNEGSGTNGFGTGTLNQTGGTANIAAGQTISLPNAPSTYNLNGGLLSVGDAGGTAAISGPGSFNFGGGNLQALGNLLTDAASGTVTGTSTITAPSAVVTLSGVLTGSGGISFRGDNATVINLTGTDSYTGLNSVYNGTLNSIPTNLSSGSLFIGSGAVVNLLGANAPTIFAGSLSGAGTFNLGANSIQINGPLDFTGTTNIGNGHSLQVFDGTLGNLGAGTGALIIGGDTAVATTGTVSLVGTNLNTGNTTINSAFTLLANSLASALVTNAGTIGSNAAAGTVFNVGTGGTGNLAENTATSHTLIRLAGTVADSFKVGSGDVLGTVNISGFSKLGTSQYTIVNSNTALNGGALQTDINDRNLIAVTDAPVLLTAMLEASPSQDQLILTVDQLPISQFALTPNQKAVANALDVALVSPVANSPFFTNFNGLTAAQIPGALDQLTPESYLYMRDIAFENTTFLAQKVDGFLGNLRAGYSGLDTSGLSILGPLFKGQMGQSLGSLLAYNSEGAAPNGVNYYPDEGEASQSNSAPLMVEPSPAGPATMSDSVDPRMAPTVAPPTSTSVLDGAGVGFNEFVSGNVILGELNQDNSGSNQPRANTTAGDITAGVSFRMTSNIAAGVLFDYNHTDALTSSQGSHVRVDSYSPGLFATFFEKGFYANGLFTFGYNDYSNDRKIEFGGTNNTAHSSPSGEQFAPNVDAGYDFHPTRQLVVGPTAGLGYTHLDVDSFHETGAGVENLNVQSQGADSLRLRLGGRAVYLVQAGNILFQPNVSASFQHEFLNDPYTLSSQLDLPGTPSFAVQGSNSGRNTGLISAGVTATFNYSMNLYLNYLVEVGGDDYIVQSIEGGLKAAF